jgi:hypothetical protein
MENLNVNQPNDLANLKKQFSDYQKKQSQKKKKTSEDILAKYFVPRKTKESFRILPKQNGGMFYDEAFFHVVTTTIAGGKKKHGTIIYCPAHNDPKIKKLDANGEPLLDGNGKPIMIPAPCPLCAKSKKILAKQDPSLKYVKKEDMTEAQKKINEKNKEIFADANKWEAKKFYIIRGIDKGAEKNGVKFWRFKHNFKNQGTLDKIMPVLEAYIDQYQADFSDVRRGTDLTLTMADSEFNGRTYKTLSAVIFGQPSPLHNDPIVAKQWLDDDISWRDVFLPKKAPNITSLEFLEMVANDSNPYWDDTDSNNKHWVFPNRPDLEDAANTRKANLDNDDEDEYFEQASDLMDEEYAPVTVNNVTPQNVGVYNDDARDISAKTTSSAPIAEPIVNDSIEEEGQDDTLPSNDYDDLPF